jgi:glycosyltransferase involved in cell wall biosynthesis
MQEYNYPKISIIIACLNTETKIAKTIQSVINQDYPNTEIIIIDGNSKDNTLAIIKSFEGHIHKVISERDYGIGDAWNKGLSLAGGKIIGILNAGDYYENAIFDKVMHSLINVSDPVIGYGDTTFFDNMNHEKKVISHYSNTKLSLLNGFGFMHPSVFFTRSVLDVIGTFDVQKRIAVDTDWLLKARMYKIPFLKIPSHTYMENGGLSMTFPYTGMGEYLDSLVKYNISRHYIILFFFFRLMGAIKIYFVNLFK